jgi:uncharacterized membrane protein YdbT with pleckstrin-like domain
MIIQNSVKLSEGEEILKVVRRHWFHLAVAGIVDVSIFVAVVFAMGSFGAVLPDALGSGYHAASLSLFIISFVGLLLWMHFFALWSDHWLDAWIITNKRVIDIEQKGFFRREVSNFPLHRIQDVTYDLSGIIAMWFKFGNVRIQTASISDDLIMKQVPFPADVKEEVVQVIDKYRDK